MLHGWQSDKLPGSRQRRGRLLRWERQQPHSLLHRRSQTRKPQQRGSNRNRNSSSNGEAAAGVGAEAARLAAAVIISIVVISLLRCTEVC